MGRTRSFDEADVVARASASFRATGYEGTGVDELLHAVGLHRGSLYRAFGSKRGLFVVVLRQALSTDPLGEGELDLVLVALLELAPRDREVRALLAGRLRRADASPAVLGARLLDRAGLTPHPSDTRAEEEP